MIIQALNAGKNVFIEKPLCLTKEELENIIKTYNSANKNKPVSLMVGFNRRFAPLTIKAKKLLGTNPGPVNVIITCNAGFIPKNHWLNDPAVGGGRLIGEACHFIDLFSFLANSPITSVYAANTGNQRDIAAESFSITLKCENGSLGIINYFANGSKKWPKERVEIYSNGRVLCIDNFRKLTGAGIKLPGNGIMPKQDKGHEAECREWVDAMTKGLAAPIPFEHTINSFLAVFAAKESVQENTAIAL
jgi:predicted dehydrogenase